jgi:hypothetical protein
MSPDEARIMRLFSTEQTIPVIEVRAYEKGASESYVMVYRCFSLIGRMEGCELETLTPVYLDNLRRLGLLEQANTIGPEGPRLTPSEIYKPLELEADQSLSGIKSWLSEQDRSLSFLRGFMQLTDLGEQFCRACVIEKGSA